MPDVVCYIKIRHQRELDFIREHNTREIRVEGYPEFPYYLIGVDNYAGTGVPCFVSIGQNHIDSILEDYGLEDKELSFIDLATALE